MIATLADRYNGGYSTLRRATMIQSIEFSNFKALRHTALPLSPFTLLLGPNGSGKSTVLQALQDIAAIAAQSGAMGRWAVRASSTWSSLRSVSAEEPEATVQVQIRFQHKKHFYLGKFEWEPHQDREAHAEVIPADGSALDAASALRLWKWLSRIQTYALDAKEIAQPAHVSGESLPANGSGLAAVLDDLKDNHPERWEALVAEMRRWLPEYDQIQFDKPEPGQKRLALRTKKGGHRIKAHELSQGTLVALALLTLAYLPDPPTVIGLEEIDRGLHPRLLRHLQDALYRLSYPESCGETRPPIQVIATTHSPYLLDLYRDHPEEVVLAQKQGLEVEMKRLTDIEHFEEILGDAPLSEVWYSGVLGGVSVKP
jgi:predicted ATPase